MAAYTNIDDPSAYFQTTLYTGNGSANHAITNSGNSDLQPDFAIQKRRNGAYSSRVWDSNRTLSNYLTTNAVDANANFTGYLKTFDTNGFTVNAGDQSVNNNGSTYVAWLWKANGGTTSSNTSGTITTTVQANTDAGFSIVTWAGSGANATMGHGLGATPQVIISKALGTTNDWNVYHRNLDPTAPYNYLLNLHNTNGRSAATGSWGTSLSDVNSSTFYMKYWINYNTNMIAYCFAEKQGYSKFGQYAGTGVAAGKFVYTGFKPAFLMVKNLDITSNWVVVDHKRDPFNMVEKYLLWSNAAAESTASDVFDVDFVSNGFKLRTNYSEVNGTGQSIVYMAFAENPFVTSTGIPTTAR